MVAGSWARRQRLAHAPQWGAAPTAFGAGRRQRQRILVAMLLKFSDAKPEDVVAIARRIFSHQATILSNFDRMMNPLKIEFPSLGWRQILTARQEILDAFDRAREQARAHEVETYHGHVAESAVRKWLAGFLPARYGVTSGYVISPGLPSTTRVPHFDVIIYDQIESPVLWIEEHHDRSPAGRSLAIPVEYVCAVLEVKSQLTTKTVRDALSHLADLKPLMQSIDKPTERYKLYLPPTFACGALFAELRADAATSPEPLVQFTNGVGLRGYFGGVVLRGEGHSLPHTGRISLLQSEQPTNSFPSGDETQLLEFAIAKSVQVAETFHLSAMLAWDEAAFAKFSFDILAMMRGTYDPGRVSSFYGQGHSPESIDPL